jgi:hypothetical protein
MGGSEFLRPWPPSPMRSGGLKITAEIESAVACQQISPSGFGDPKPGLSTGDFFEESTEVASIV